MLLSSRKRNSLGCSAGFMCLHTKLRALTSSPIPGFTNPTPPCATASGDWQMGRARRSDDSGLNAAVDLIQNAAPIRQERPGSGISGEHGLLSRSPTSCQTTIWWQVEETTWLLRPWMGAHDGAQWRIGKRVKRAFGC